MAPPAIAKIEAGLRAQKKGGASGSAQSPSKVTKHVQKPKQVDLSKLPAEIQQMIWSEAMPKPACHTFKFTRLKWQDWHVFDPAMEYRFDLQVLPSNRDPSAYRYWRSLLWNRKYDLPADEPEKSEKKAPSKVSKSKVPKPGKAKAEKPKLEGPELERLNTERANLRDPYKPSIQKSREAFSKLANVSFQAGFRRSMIQLETLSVYIANVKEQTYEANLVTNGSRKYAAIDTATDLVILEFDRGETVAPHAWFEHATGKYEVGVTRKTTRPLKRVAVHYKRSHPQANRRSPFQCWCPANSPLQCETHKACPMEQACMLDSFENLEEFYYVVEMTKQKELAWLAQYKDHARRQGYKLETSGDSKKPKFELAHFYDMKNEFLQLCPKGFIKFLPEELRTSPVLPLDAMGDPRDCLCKVSDIYKGKQGKDDYHNDVEQRKKVKFGILVSIKLQE